MRFFSHAWRGVHCFADETGLEVPDRLQARTLAARALGEMARDALYASADPVSTRLGAVPESPSRPRPIAVTPQAGAARPARPKPRVGWVCRPSLSEGLA